MQIRVDRYKCGAKSTLGNLCIDGKWFCYSLEDADRKLEVNPEAKVYGETCIPRGTYEVIINYSNRFKVEMPLLLGVDGFEGVRIHPGNTNEDTHGCILVGTRWGTSAQGDYIVMNSRAAYNALFDLIDTALERQDKVTLEVV